MEAPGADCRRWRMIAFSLFVAIAAVSVGAAEKASLNIANFGAVGDGVTLNTKSIQQAIDACSRQGGGVVTFPGGRFVSGTILLKDNVTLRLESGAELLGSTNIADYLAPDKFRTGNNAEMGHCFIGGIDVKNVGIEGSGLIDGRGKALLDARPEGNRNRPFLGRFVRAEGVRIRDVRLTGSAAWTVHFFQSKTITVERVTIRCRGLSNNDGIDIDSSQDVIIRDCDIDTGDDAICLKATSPMASRGVEISGCKLTSHWGGVKFGTESMGDFEDVRISNCEIRDARGGIKLLSVDGARLQSVTVSNVTMHEVTVPLFMRLGARLRTFREGHEPKPVGTIRNVSVKRLRATAKSEIGILMSGIPGHPIRNVSLEDIDIRLPGGGKKEDATVVLEEKESAYPEITMFGRQFPAYGLFARHVQDFRATSVKLDLLAPDPRVAIVVEDGVNVELLKWTFPRTEEPCSAWLRAVKGAQTDFNACHLTNSEPASTR